MIFSDRALRLQYLDINNQQEVGPDELLAELLTILLDVDGELLKLFLDDDTGPSRFHDTMVDTSRGYTT